MNRVFKGINTTCIHAGGYVDEATGGVTTPIFRSTSHITVGRELRYPRLFNIPTENAAAEKICALEGGQKAVVLGSGMAAITTVLFALLRKGDHAVFQGDLYGGTYNFVASELDGFGIEASFVDGEGPEDFRRELRPNTKLIYIETPSNPLLKIVDLDAISKLATGKGLLTVIDNTFATPINQTPLDFGIDVIVHSGTKYLNGHSDVLCGAIVSSNELMKRILPFASNHGGVLDPQGCYLLERGLKTLALRVRRQNENAMELATFLKGHKLVRKVYHPGLPEHPGHELAVRQMRGFGGMLSFELDCGIKEARNIVGRLKLITPAGSLGGVESLICFPAETSHAKMPRAEREKIGITDTLLRLSVGIEDAEDLKEDILTTLTNL